MDPILYMCIHAQCQQYYKSRGLGTQCGSTLIWGVICGLIVKVIYFIFSFFFLMPVILLTCFDSVKSFHLQVPSSDINFHYGQTIPTVFLVSFL